MLRFIAIGAIVLVGGPIILFALGLAYLVLGKSDPTWHRQDGVRAINCYGSSPENTVSVPITVEYQDNGHTAVLHYGRDTFRLPLQSGSFFNDVYSSGTIELRIDPEVYLEGLRDSRIGPCDLE
jgi:hypothetical protein